MAAIDFLNPAPLMWDFEHEPGRNRLLERYTINYTTPSNCASQLSAGEADLGLIPVAGYATAPSLLIVPGCTIASLDRVRSILLVVRPSQGISAVKRVAMDTSSRTSSAYTRILFENYWKVSAEFVPHVPDLEAMLNIADAAMLIGDPALLALEDREAREQRSGEKLLYLDLAHEWHTFTGLPWVSAFWAVREDALNQNGIDAQTLVDDLLSSRDRGLAHIDDLVTEWTARIAVPTATIREYLTTNIHYTLDDLCLHAIEVFYREAAACGALPHVPELNLL
jgi:chorismate dehydratase